MNRKELPPRDPWLVLHPESNKHYVHFEGAREHPFIANAPTIPRRNAWWLADAALLAYYDEAFALKQYKEAGLTAELFDKNGLQAYLAYADDFVIVAFRGTQPDEWKDIFVDAMFSLVPYRDGTRVHQGFKKSLDGVWPQLRERLTDLGRSRSVWFAGHSLGAALAVLAADLFESTQGVCTLGCPRLGDAAFAAAFDARLGRRSLRYVNDADIVTHVPPSLPGRYHHVSAIRYIPPQGAITTAEPELPHFFSTIFGDTAHMLELVNALEARTFSTAPDAFLDHMPQAYAVHIWNDYVDHAD